MTTMLYMDDMLLREWDAKVISVKDGKFAILDRTAFYPNAGGVEWDTGSMKRKSDGAEFKVIFAGKFEGEISHEFAPTGLAPGDEVRCNLDWERRYKLMRYHTSAHVLLGMFSKESDAKATGNQLTTEKGRIDLNLDNFDRPLIDRVFEKSNALIEQDLPIIVYYKPKAEALADPIMVKLANIMPPDVENIRVVDIKGFDYQADGGCHVSHLKEIGKITFLSAENKGKANRRVYFKLD